MLSYDVNTEMRSSVQGAAYEMLNNTVYDKNEILEVKRCRSEQA